MLCQNPFTRGTATYPCGQCMPCRFNRRRMWAHRIMLEAAQHGDNCFVTLTYDDAHLPEGGTLVPEHFQRWLKRIRKHWSPRSIRFYGVGEYGNNSNRPHYHAAIFGYPNCAYGNTRIYLKSGRCCECCNGIKDTWGMGAVLLGDLSVHSAQYVAGYVTKKMTRTDDPRLNGRWPEFCRMSLRPGIGVSAMHEVADVLMKHDLDTSQTDVPVSLRHGGRELPLGRHLRSKLRLMCGKDAKAPTAALEEQKAEMSPLYEAVLDGSVKAKNFKEAVLEINKGKVASFMAKQRIYKRKDKI